MSVKELKGKKVKGRITVLRALPYRDNMIYIRMIDKDLFEWILVFKDQVYSSYLVITPRSGKSKLSQKELGQVTALLLAGATATVDTLMGEKLDTTKEGIVKAFEHGRVKGGD